MSPHQVPAGYMRAGNVNAANPDHIGEALWCGRCASLVRHTRDAVTAHDEFHRDVDRALEMAREARVRPQPDVV